MLLILIIITELMTLLFVSTNGWSDLMTCSKWPSMGFQNMGTMGSTVTSYSSNQIYINGAPVVGNTGTYTPGSTIRVSLSPYSGQLVFQANNGAVFQGPAGKRNKNGLLTGGCTTVSRYQMYTNTDALLTMPSSGNVKIECNFASTSGRNSVRIPIPIILSPFSILSIIPTHSSTKSPTIIPSIKPSFPTIAPSKAPIAPSVKTTFIPTAPTKTPVYVPPSLKPSFKPTVYTSIPSQNDNVESLPTKERSKDSDDEDPSETKKPSERSKKPGSVSPSSSGMITSDSAFGNLGSGVIAGEKVLYVIFSMIFAVFFMMLVVIGSFIYYNRLKSHNEETEEISDNTKPLTGANTAKEKGEAFEYEDIYGENSKWKDLTQQNYEIEEKQYDEENNIETESLEQVNGSDYIEGSRLGLPTLNSSANLIDH